MDHMQNSYLKYHTDSIESGCEKHETLSEPKFGDMKALNSWDLNKVASPSGPRIKLIIEVVGLLE